jgi:hypothetical protein
MQSGQRRSSSENVNEVRGGEQVASARSHHRIALGVVLFGIGAALLSACLDRPIGAVPPVTTNQFVDKINQARVSKIDLLLMIDNSASMSDKQAILRRAVPDLVGRLVNPVCIDAAGNRGATPPPGAACPAGQSREFNAIEDINVGIISSSLGDAGAESVCAGPGAREMVPDGLDLAHLMGSLARGRQAGANPQGFLEWRAGTTDPQAFSESFERLVASVGENGCGWEASLESWYRFLVDPFPYRELVRVRCPSSDSEELNCVQPATDAAGRLLRDETLLEQRRAFLRPDSLVAVIMLSDENDCSIQVGGSSWLVADPSRRMYRGSSACDADPNAKCCYRCGGSVPEGCAADPICTSDTAEDAVDHRLPRQDDGSNLRCFEQKRRFGVDLLYPTARYVNALTQRELCWNAPDLSLDGCAADDRVVNPLYAEGRDPALVFLGGIVGVPWQNIASDVDGNSRALSDPTTQLRFKTFEQLNADDTWSKILGSPGASWQPASVGRPERAAVPRVLPENPLMIESQFPRPGVESGNVINGRDYDTGQGRAMGVPNDLQYACIFPLPTPRVCSTADCDCSSGAFDRPLCEQRPGEGNPGTTQYWSKAYPGLRQLQVLRDFGKNSIVASICARNVDVEARPDFGYRPAVDAIVDRLKERLGDRCLPRGLLADDDGSVPCTLVETVPRPAGACECDERIARVSPNARVGALVREELARDPARPCSADDPGCNRACLCEVLQVQDANPNPTEALRSCREDENTSGIEGWCYVADTSTQQIGSSALVAECPPTQRQILRFVGGGLGDNTTTFVACKGASFTRRESDAERE